MSRRTGAAWAVSLLAHCLVFAALLSLPAHTPDLPPMPPDFSAGMMFMGGAAAPGPEPLPVAKPSPTASAIMPPPSRQILAGPKPPPRPAPPRSSPRPPVTRPASSVNVALPDGTPSEGAPASAAPAPRLLGGMSGKCLADYPEPLRRRAVQGRVMVRVAIAADGTPRAASVAAGSGSGQLDRLALEAVRVCRHFPQAAEAYVADIPYTFQLTD